MMGGNPNYWWGMYSPSSLFLPNHVLGSSSSSSSSSIPCHGFADNQEHRQSLSLLLLGGLSAGDEERTVSFSHFQPDMLENLEYLFLNPSLSLPGDDIKYEELRTTDDYFELPRRPFSQVNPASSPSSCATNGVSNDTILDFSYNSVDKKIRLSRGLSEFDRIASVGTGKKARVQPSSTQPPLKVRKRKLGPVRKEKLGERITALHQLVSPFGKTDTASVLTEAIGYIKFLHGQMEALTSPLLRNASKTMRNQPLVQTEGHSVFPEDPGQLLNGPCLSRKATPHQDNGFPKNNQETARDLRSKGLCLAPVSWTLYVGTGTENGADHWAPGCGAGF